MRVDPFSLGLFAMTFDGNHPGAIMFTGHPAFESCGVEWIVYPGEVRAVLDNAERTIFQTSRTMDHGEVRCVIDVPIEYADIERIRSIVLGRSVARAR